MAGMTEVSCGGGKAKELTVSSFSVRIVGVLTEIQTGTSAIKVLEP